MHGELAFDGELAFVGGGRPREGAPGEGMEEMWEQAWDELFGSDTRYTHSFFAYVGVSLVCNM